MPLRTRAHELETESKRAFDRILPSAWEARGVHPDYGVDLEVEIFEGGAATGKTFRVQLKGTDRPPKNGRCSVPVDSRTLSYWRELDSPVLVVLWVAATGDLYARWAHSYDPYASRARPNAKTVTFLFVARDKMISSTYQRISREVDLIREFRGRKSLLPLPLRIDLPAQFHGHSENVIRAQFRQAIQNCRSMLRIVSDDSAAIVLSLRQNGLKVALPADLASTTIHVESNAYVGAESVRALVADSLVATASLLVTVGLARAGTAIAQKFANDSGVAQFFEAMELFVHAFVAERYLAEALRAVGPAIDSPDVTVRDQVVALLYVIFLHPDAEELLAESDYRTLIKRLESKAAIDIANGDPQMAGPTWYTISNFLRMIKDYPGSLAALERAAELDPNYRSRGYFFKDCAGMRFSLGQYADAARDYRRAVDAGDSPEAAFLLANALMFAGMFHEAQSVTWRPESIPAYYAVGARIQRRVQGTIVSIVQMDRQDRRPMNDEDLARLVEPEPISRNDLVKALHEHDALDPRVWCLLAMVSSDPKATYEYMVVAAELMRHSDEVWAAAIVLGVVANETDASIEDVCTLALRRVGTDIFAAVERFPGESVSQNDKTRALAILSVCGDRDPVASPRVLRLQHRDGTYDVLEAGSEPENGR